MTSKLDLYTGWNSGGCRRNPKGINMGMGGGNGGCYIVVMRGRKIMGKEGGRMRRKGDEVD